MIGFYFMFLENGGFGGGGGVFLSSAPSLLKMGGGVNTTPHPLFYPPVTHYDNTKLLAIRVLHRLV